LEAAKRWMEREPLRKQTGNIKAINKEEEEIAVRRIENNVAREARRPAFRTDLVMPIIFPERIIKGNDLKELPQTNWRESPASPLHGLKTFPLRACKRRLRNGLHGITKSFIDQQSCLSGR
jgi:hypothetical protein